MPREREDFRDQLQALRERYEGQEVLTLAQSCAPLWWAKTRNLSHS